MCEVQRAQGKNIRQIDLSDNTIDPMNISSVNLNLMVALQALLIERSVTRAAMRCGLTQSSMSYSLGRLRGLFDDPLLVRRGGKLVPTPLATALTPRLQSALTDLELVLQVKQLFDPATNRRRFRVAASDMFQLAALPQLLGEVAHTAPGVDLVIKPLSSVSFERLASGALDVVIDSSTTARPSGICMRELFRQHHVCIVRDGHPRAAGRISLPTFCTLSHVLVAPDEEPGLLDRALEAIGRSRHVAVRIPDYAAVGHVVANTELIATVPILVAETLARTLPLKIVRLPLEVRDFAVCIYWHERYDTDPGSRWLRELLCAVAEGVLHKDSPRSGRTRGRVHQSRHVRTTDQVR